MLNLRNLFRKKIIIPLVRNGVPIGQWVECYKGDHIYQTLIMLYGKPLPKHIEVEPIKKDKNV